MLEISMWETMQLESYFRALAETQRVLAWASDGWCKCRVGGGVEAIPSHIDDFMTRLIGVMPPARFVAVHWRPDRTFGIEVVAGGDSRKQWGSSLEGALLAAEQENRPIRLRKDRAPAGAGASYVYFGNLDSVLDLPALLEAVGVHESKCFAAEEALLRDLPPADARLVIKEVEAAVRQLQPEPELDDLLAALHTRYEATASN